MPSTRISSASSLAEAAFDALGGRVAQPSDRTVFVRAFADAAAAWNGSASTRWWKWGVEACSAIGLRAKLIECTVTQARAIAARGVDLLTFVEEAGGRLLVVTEFRRRKFDVIENGKRVRLSPAALAARLGCASTEAPILWVVAEGHAPVTSADAGHAHEHPSPLSRLMTLLWAERTDLWVVVVFAVFGAVLTLATPLAIQALVDTVAFGRYLQPVIVLSLLLFTFLAFGAAMRALQMYVVEIVQRRLFARVVSDLAQRLPRVRHDESDEYLPETVNRFFDVVTVQKAAASLLLDGVALVIATLVGMAVLAFYHPWLLGFDVVLLVLMAMTVFILGRGAVPSSIRESKTKYATAAWLEDVARCRTAFAHAGAEAFAAHRADELTTRYLKDRKSHFRVLMRQVGFALGLQAVAGTILLGLGGWLVISEKLSLGQLVAAELIVTVIVGSFAKLGKHMESYYDLAAAIDKLGHLFDLPIESRDGLPTFPRGISATLRVANLSAGFTEGVPVLENISFSVEAGEAVALFGPSGCGKTLLSEILFGLRAPFAGYVEFADMDPRDLRPDVYRGHVALAGPFEFLEDSITENVRLDRPYVGLSEVREALRCVGILEELLAKPLGLKTKLDPRGAPLSGGACRRLLLARAIAGQPRLLIVDGLLDAASDIELEEIVDGLTKQGCTLVVLTGRREVASRFPRSIAIGGGALSPASSHRIGAITQEAVR